MNKYHLQMYKKDFLIIFMQLNGYYQLYFKFTLLLPKNRPINLYFCYVRMTSDSYSL